MAPAPESRLVKLLRRAGTAAFYVESFTMVVSVIFSPSWAIGLHPDVLQYFKDIWKNGVSLMASYDGNLPLNLHYAKAPVGRYSHMLMALPWTILAMVQVSTRIRTRYPRVHRTLGYTFFAASASMVVGVVDIAIKKVGFYR
jgi:hypothetical protein